MVVWLIIGSVLTIGSLTAPKVQYETAAVASLPEAPGLDSDSQALQPHGWRRTVDGWEHTSNWLSTDKSIDTWIQEQRSREPAWIQRILATIRATPPLVFMMMQVAMVTAVILITTRKNLSGS